MQQTITTQLTTARIHAFLSIMGYLAASEQTNKRKQLPRLHPDHASRTLWCH